MREKIEGLFKKLNLFLIRLFGNELNYEEAKRMHGVYLRYLPKFVEFCITEPTKSYNVGFYLESDFIKGQTLGWVYVQRKAGKKIDGIWKPGKKQFYVIEIDYKKKLRTLEERANDFEIPIENTGINRENIQTVGEIRERIYNQLPFYIELEEIKLEDERTIGDLINDPVRYNYWFEDFRINGEDGTYEISGKLVLECKLTGNCSYYDIKHYVD